MVDEIVVNETPDDPIEETDDTTVVVAPVVVNPDDGGSDDTALAILVGEMAATLKAQGEQITALQAQQEATAVVADVAFEAASETADVEVVAEEAEVDDPADDTSPNGKPWTHRSARELFGSE